MELKNLQKIVLALVLVGMIMGVGLLVFDNFGAAVRDPISTSENVNSSLGTFTVTYKPIKTVARFGNATAYNTSFNCAGCEVNYTAATGVFVVNNDTFNPSLDWYVNYTYYSNSTATDTVTNMNAAISPIASTWLALIVTIIVLSIILTLVMKSFVVRR